MRRTCQNIQPTRYNHILPFLIIDSFCSQRCTRDRCHIVPLLSSYLAGSTPPRLHQPPTHLPKDRTTTRNCRESPGTPRRFMVHPVMPTSEWSTGASTTVHQQIATEFPRSQVTHGIGNNFQYRLVSKASRDLTTINAHSLRKD